MKQGTEKFNIEKTIQNIASLLELKLEELLYYDIINDVFETIDIE